MSTPSRIAFIGNHAIFSPPFMRALRHLPQADLVAIGTAAPGHHTALPSLAVNSARTALNAFLAGLPERLWHQLPPHMRTVARQGARVLRGRGNLVFAANVNDAEFVARICAARPDLIIVAGLNQIFRPPAIAALPPMLNVHPSLLPSYRGANPAFWQIRNNEQHSGVTMHHIDAGVDTGPVVAQQEFPIATWMNRADLMAAAAEVAVQMLPAVVRSYFAQTLTTLTPRGKKSYHGFPQPDDFRLRSDWSVQAALNASRAAAPDAQLFVYVDRSFWQGYEKNLGHCAPLREPAAPRTTQVFLGAPEALSLGDPGSQAGTLTYVGRDRCRVQLRDGAITFGRVRAA